MAAFNPLIYFRAKLLFYLFIQRVTDSLIEDPSTLLQVQVDEKNKSLYLKFTYRSNFIDTHNCSKTLVLSRTKSLYNVWSRHSRTLIVDHWQSNNCIVESFCRCEESVSSWLKSLLSAPAWAWLCISISLIWEPHLRFVLIYITNTQTVVTELTVILSS